LQEHIENYYLGGSIVQDNEFERMVEVKKGTTGTMVNQNMNPQSAAYNIPILENNQ
jgi:hypothetical protein